MGRRHVPEFPLVVPVELKDLEKLFSRASELTKHTEFVVFGSNSVLGVPRDHEIPPRMTMSNDVDTYTNVDPKYGFLAVYAGATESEAREFLKKVNALDRFKGANVRRMQAVLAYP